MKVTFHKKFKKQYKKLIPYQRNQVDAIIDVFMSNPYHSSLYNHSLKGRLKGLRSISAGFDVRIVFQEKDNYFEVLFLSVGSHNQVYPQS